MIKQCPSCKGDGFQMVDETPEDCIRCKGTGEIDTDDLFEQMVELVTPYNEALINAYSR